MVGDPRAIVGNLDHGVVHSAFKKQRNSRRGVLDSVPEKFIDHSIDQPWRCRDEGAKLLTHSHLLAYSAWPLATAHYILAGTDALADWSMGLVVTAGSLIVFGMLVRGFVPPKRVQDRLKTAS